ncbi:MAG: ABC transporter permease [Longicatena sp.]
MKALIKRNMMLFFYDKTAVFFSFMAVFVVLGLYCSFLGDMMIEPLKVAFPKYARELSDTWIMAGTLGIVSLTTSLSVLGIIIADRSNHIVNDFEISPLSKGKIMLSYIISSVVLTCFVSVVTLLIGQIYIVAYGGRWMSMSTLIKVLGVMLLSIMSNTSMLYFFMSFFRSATSFSNITTIIGTLSGFLMGIYVPMGALPNYLQRVITYFPPSHCAALYRNIMMHDVMNDSFINVPIEAITTFKKNFGLLFTYGSHTTSTLEHVGLIALTGIFFYILLKLQKKNRT